IASWIADAAAKEEEIRKFLDARSILTVPAWLQHYTLRPIPDYLLGLGFTEEDDFTSPARLQENCIRYVNVPSANSGYFMRATAQYPRPLTVHEGIPGHYFQLCLSWKHEDPIRRHYYDSGANEGIGFYAVEMMLQAGLFDDRRKQFRVARASRLPVSASRRNNVPVCSTRKSKFAWRDAIASTETRATRARTAQRTLIQLLASFSANRARSQQRSDSRLR